MEGVGTTPLGKGKPRLGGGGIDGIKRGRGDGRPPSCGYEVAEELQSLRAFLGQGPTRRPHTSVPLTNPAAAAKNNT